MRARMSIGVVASDSPAMAPLARALQPGLRSPARKGSTGAVLGVGTGDQRSLDRVRLAEVGVPRTTRNVAPSDRDPPATSAPSSR